MRYNPIMDDPRVPRPPFNDRARGDLGDPVDLAVAVDDREEWAFEVWAFVESRNVAAVSRRTGVPEQTIRDWRNRHDWNGKLAERLTQIAPHIDAGTVVDLVYARSHGATRLRNHLNPEHPEKMEKTDLIAVDLALKAAAALAPNGLADVMRGGRFAGIAPPQRLTIADLNAMTPAERQALIDGQWE
jgi:hypothetical protein